MQRKSVHPGADGRELPPGDRAKALQECHACRDCLVRRTFEPLEGAWVPAPCKDVEQRAGQVDSMDFRHPMRLQPVGVVPETEDDARPETSSPACPLICGVGS